MPENPVIPEGMPASGTQVSTFKWIVGVSMGGGLGVILTWVLVNSMVKDTREMQDYLRTQFINELKNTSQNNALAAKAMEDAADAMEEQARSGKDTALALEKMAIANDRLTDTNVRLTESIDQLIEERKEASDARRSEVVPP